MRDYSSQAVRLHTISDIMSRTDAATLQHSLKQLSTGPSQRVSQSTIKSLYCPSQRLRQTRE